MANRLNALEPELQGRIADFLNSDDRSSMRQLSRENRVVYSRTPKYQYTIRQRLSLIDLENGFRTSTVSFPRILIVNQFSSEIGTTQDREKLLDDINYSEFYKIFPRFQRNVFGFLPEAPLQYRELWRITKYEFSEFLFKIHLTRIFTSAESGERNRYSLFSPSEVQDLIQDRIRNGNRFPFTLVKFTEFNILDLAKENLKAFNESLEPVRTINDLVKFIFVLSNHYDEDNPEHPFWQWLTNYFIGYLGGDGNTSVDGFRKFFRFRYMHEINVEMNTLESLTYPHGAAGGGAGAAGGGAGAAGGGGAGGAGSGGAGSGASSSDSFSGDGEKRRRF